MRNDTTNWDAPHARDAAITAPGITIQQVQLKRQTTVSGVDVLHYFCPATGWPDVARGPSYAVALRRDRVLLLDGPPLTDGWNDKTGHAVSDMTGGYAVIDLSGEAVHDVLKRGADINPNIRSGSAARLFAGIGVILYHFDAPMRLRLHVSAAQRDTLWQTLESYVRRMD